MFTRRFVHISTLNTEGQAVVHSFNHDTIWHMLTNSPQSKRSTVSLKGIPRLKRQTSIPPIVIVQRPLVSPLYNDGYAKASVPLETLNRRIRQPNANRMTTVSGFMSTQADTYPSLSSPYTDASSPFPSSFTNHLPLIFSKNTQALMLPYKHSSRPPLEDGMTAFFHPMRR
jgi:hypothetical protein